MIRTIKTEYNRDSCPAWTINKSISKESKYIKKNTSRGHFAIINLSFDSFTSEVPVTFDNKAILQAEYRGDDNLEEEFNLYVERIVKTLEEEISEMYRKGYPIIDIKISLCNLEIHPIDSNEFSYKIATQIAVNEVLSPNNLIAVNSQD